MKGILPDIKGFSNLL